MKVILLQDVKGTGKKDQVIEVSDGFARNCLFKKKLAVEATSTEINAINNKKKLKPIISKRKSKLGWTLQINLEIKKLPAKLNAVKTEKFLVV